MIELIAGNIFSGLAMATDSFSASRKTAKSVLLVQCLSQVFYALSGFVLGGYSAAVQNIVSLVRNVVAIRGIQKKWIEWALVISGVVFGLYFNNLGFMGLLPVLANLEYTLAIFRFKDNEWMLKLAFLVCVILFIIFNLAIQNYVGFVCNAVLAVMLISFLIKTRKK